MFNDKEVARTIYTLGHSTYTITEFLDMLRFFNIKILVDIRRLPGSRKFPQFDQDTLKISLEEVGIQYVYSADLGGRRKASKDSKTRAGTTPLFADMPIIWKLKYLPTLLSH